MIKKLCSIVAVTFLAVSISPAMAGGAKDSGGSWTGNIGIHSKYVLRGITNNAEADNGALQGGFDYDSGAGWYAGIWASSLDYAYDSGGGTTSGNGFENDLYIGYKGELGSISFDVGLIQYLYVDVDDSNLTELKVAATFGPVTVQVQYLLNDGFWGNAGDQYWTLNYEKKLPKKFTLGLSYGYYIYEDNDSNELCAGASLANNCALTTSDSGFRHFNVTLSHPIGKTGGDMYVQYINAGEDRTGTDHEDTMVLGITYGFDL